MRWMFICWKPVIKIIIFSVISVGRFIKPIILTIFFFHLKRQSTFGSTLFLILPDFVCEHRWHLAYSSLFSPSLIESQIARSIHHFVLECEIKAPTCSISLTHPEHCFTYHGGCTWPYCMPMLNDSREKNPYFYRHHWFLARHWDRPI